MQQQIIRETFLLVSKRDDNVCNFLEGGTLIGGSDYRLIYRHYATLYFVFCVDSSESELGILDLIQVFVETLDKCFENVCELDLIFHVDKVHYILNELVMGGMVLETNMAEIITRIEEQAKLERQEVLFLLNLRLPQTGYACYILGEDVISPKCREKCLFLEKKKLILNSMSVFLTLYRQEYQQPLQEPSLPSRT
jgi:AP-3 complex subunit sigma